MSYNGGRRGRSPAQNINRGSRSGSRGGRGKKRVNRSFDSNTSFLSNLSQDDLHERKKLNKKKRRHSLSTFSDLYSDINVNFKDCFRVEPSPSQKRKSGKKNKQKKPHGPILLTSPATPMPKPSNSNSGGNRGSSQRGGRGNFRGNRRNSNQPQLYFWDYSKDEEKEEKEISVFPEPKLNIEKPVELARDNAPIESEIKMELNVIDELSSEESEESESESSGSEGIEDDEEDAEFDMLFGTQKISHKLEDALGAQEGDVIEEVSGESSDYSYGELDDEPDDDLIRIELTVKDKNSQSSKSKQYREELNQGSDNEEDEVVGFEENESGTDEEALADYMENAELDLDGGAISNLILYDNYSSEEEIDEDFLFESQKSNMNKSKPREKYSKSFVKPGEMEEDYELAEIKEGVQGLLTSSPMFEATSRPRSFKERLALTTKDKKELRKKRKEKKKRKKNKGFSLDELYALNKTVRAFLQDDEMNSVPFAPMNRCQRLQFHNLCNCYGLRTKSFGSGAARFPSVYKTTSSILIPMATIASTLEYLSSATIETLKQSLVSPNPMDPVNRATPNVKSGNVVGQFAPPIDDSNLGSKILQKMGWSGGGLGATGQGIENPIEVVFKNNKRGLGFQ